jgi:cytochrome c-type biogenesis protein CcmF
MIVETGHYALVLALAVALVGALVPLVGVSTSDRRLMALAPSAAIMGFAFVATSYVALTYAHVVSDFSLANVVENSHSLKPLIYKVSGVWGNHEGSMLLWVLVLSLFGALVALTSSAMPEDFRAAVLAVQSWIGAAFILFILLTSNPFARLVDAPMEGRDLNPILQDPGLAIHPPLLYLGYVGLSITYSFAAGALICGRIDTVFARFVRPWTLLAWIALTLGIAMGSYWAYYTLGWGGFWFWDPVENASLMPWLAATALLHCTAVMERREALKIWTIFLAILAFSLSLLGTFLVRSGVLTSVHAFASDPTRGVFILAILVFFIGGSLALFALRAGVLKQGGLFAPISREGALVVNNLLLTTCCATVLVGTLYPLALESVTGEKISVGAPFFNLTFVPLFLPLFLLMPLGQNLAWKRGDLLAAAQRLWLAFAVGLGVALVTEWLRGGPVVSTILVGVAVYAILGSFAEIGRRVLGVPLAESGRRLMGLPRQALGTACAHAGLGLTLLGLAATGWGGEKIIAMKPGDSAEVGPYTIIPSSSAGRSCARGTRRSR